MKNRKRALYVQKIPDGCTKKHLIDLFERYGPVFDVLINRTSAYVHFENPGDAQKALA